MAGQPAYFKTPEQMQHRIDLYFLACKAHQLADTSILNGLPDEDLLIISKVDDIYPSVTGLALALGFCSRQSLIDYSNKDEFFDTVKTARLRVENAVEQRLFFNNATGSIFNLKNNFDWKDKSESETYGKDGGAIKGELLVRYVDGKDE